MCKSWTISGMIDKCHGKSHSWKTCIICDKPNSNIVERKRSNKVKKNNREVSEITLQSVFERWTQSILKLT